MADVRDWGKFIRGRWNWSAGGYEAGFPRGCQFTDLDAAIEFDGQALVIETKHYDGTGYMSPLDDGQRMFLRDEARRGKAVIVLWGCGPCNDPWFAKVIGPTRDDDAIHDWRKIEDKQQRRRLLKALIDEGLGIKSEQGAA